MRPGVKPWLYAGLLVGWLAAIAQSTNPPSLAPSPPSPAGAKAAAPSPSSPEASPTAGLANAVSAAVRAQIDAGAMPGAVVIMGDDKGIWFEQAHGARALLPEREPMTLDTVFDLASLTKVVATTTAAMQLVEQGQLQLDETVAHYWPAFAANGKGAVTVRQLLAHTSGLRPDIDTNPPWMGEEAGLKLVVAEKLQSPPGACMVYSDTNFIVLGELVRRVSGLALPEYARTHIFEPLGMVDTGFLPAANLRPRIAPTELRGDGSMMRGQVHDPIAHRMGDWAGHAGAFGTAQDLARMALAIVRTASGQAQPGWLKPDTQARMVKLQSPDTQAYWRGLGWSLDAPLWADRESLPPVGLIGHTGYTGTGMWMDLVQKRFLILMSNRVHPRGLGDARPLRRELLALMASQQAPQPFDAVVKALPSLADTPAHPAPPPPVGDVAAVSTGIDVLRAQGYATLQGQRVGLITNLSATDAKGWRTLDRLRWAPGVQLRKVFTPEHGLNRDQEGRIASGTDALSGLPLVSLYGKQLRPSPEMLAGLDTLVFDLQDAGARFYTYISTMSEAMQAAAQANLNFVVLDRPNPIGADRVGGPVLDADLRSFTAAGILPVQHGMTVGELARWFKDDIKARTGLDVKLQVVAMQGYKRGMRFDQTGLDWIPPSPNLRTLRSALLYPGTSWVEGANISVGRGTEHPFEWIGAPWINADQLAQALQAAKLPGVSITPIHFTPDSSAYQGQVCHGVQIGITDKDKLDAPRIGLALTHTLFKLWPGKFEVDKTLGMIGSRETLSRIRQGQPVDAIAKGWQEGLNAFMAQRATYLLY
ncbi:MAG: DUF1343 domain-containing protein [Aquabacterium sp.]